MRFIASKRHYVIATLFNRVAQRLLFAIGGVKTPSCRGATLLWRAVMTGRGKLGVANAELSNRGDRRRVVWILQFSQAREISSEVVGLQLAPLHSRLAGSHAIDQVVLVLNDVAELVGAHCCHGHL